MIERQNKVASVPDPLGFLTLSTEKPFQRLHQKTKSAGFKNVHKANLRPHVQFDMLADDGGGDGRLDLDATDAEGGPSEKESSDDDDDGNGMVSAGSANAAAEAASSSDRVIGSGITRFFVFVYFERKKESKNNEAPEWSGTGHRSTFPMDTSSCLTVLLASLHATARFMGLIAQFTATRSLYQLVTFWLGWMWTFLIVPLGHMCTSKTAGHVKVGKLWDIVRGAVGFT